MISTLGLDSLRLLELSNLICCLDLSSFTNPIDLFNYLKSANYCLRELYQYMKNTVLNKKLGQTDDGEVINVSNADFKQWENWTKLTDVCSTKSCIEATPLLYDSRLVFKFLLYCLNLLLILFIQLGHFLFIAII